MYIHKFNQINIKHPPIDKLMSEDLKKEDLKILKRVKSYLYKEDILFLLTCRTMCPFRC